MSIFLSENCVYIHLIVLELEQEDTFYSVGFVDIKKNSL